MPDAVAAVADGVVEEGAAHAARRDELIAATRIGACARGKLARKRVARIQARLLAMEMLTSELCYSIDAEDGASERLPESRDAQPSSTESLDDVAYPDTDAAKESAASADGDASSKLSEIAVDVAGELVAQAVDSSDGGAGNATDPAEEGEAAMAVERSGLLPRLAEPSAEPEPDRVSVSHREISETDCEQAAKAELPANSVDATGCLLPTSAEQVAQSSTRETVDVASRPDALLIVKDPAVRDTPSVESESSGKPAETPSNTPSQNSSLVGPNMSGDPDATAADRETELARPSPMDSRESQAGESSVKSTTGLVDQYPRSVNPVQRGKSPFRSMPLSPQATSSRVQENQGHQDRVLEMSEQQDLENSERDGKAPLPAVHTEAGDTGGKTQLAVTELESSSDKVAQELQTDHSTSSGREGPQQSVHSQTESLVEQVGLVAEAAAEAQPEPPPQPVASLALESTPPLVPQPPLIAKPASSVSQPRPSPTSARMPRKRAVVAAGSWSASQPVRSAQRKAIRDRGRSIASPKRPAWEHTAPGDKQRNTPRRETHTNIGTQPATKISQSCWWMAAIERRQFQSAENVDARVTTEQHNERPKISVLKPQVAPAGSAKFENGEAGSNTTIADQAARRRDELIAATRIAAHIRGKLARRRVARIYSNVAALAALASELGYSSDAEDDLQVLPSEQLPCAAQPVPAAAAHQTQSLDTKDSNTTELTEADAQAESGDWHAKQASPATRIEEQVGKVPCSEEGEAAVSAADSAPTRESEPQPEEGHTQPQELAWHVDHAKRLPVQEAASTPVRAAQTGSSWWLAAIEHGSSTPVSVQTGSGKGTVAAVRSAGRAEITQKAAARREHDIERDTERRREEARAQRRHQEQHTKTHTKRSARAQRLPRLGV